MNRRCWRAAAAAALLVAVGACAGSDHPGIRACKGAAGVGEDLAHGTLAVLPSTVPGSEIDSAAWFTTVLRSAGVSAFLVLSTRIAVTRPPPDEGLALIYRFEGEEAPPPIVDTGLAEPLLSATPEERANWPADRERGPRAVPGKSFRTETSMDLGGALYVPRRLSFAGCPASVQLVPHRDLALHLGSGERWAGMTREELRREIAKRGGTGDLRVVWDTLLGRFSPQLVGLVANASDRPAGGHVARFVLGPDSGFARTPGAHVPGPDTLEFALPVLAPGAVVALAGGALDYGERVVSRTVVDTGEVIGRPVPGPADGYRVSRVPGRPNP